MDSLSEMFRARIELSSRTKATLLSAYSAALQKAAKRSGDRIDFPRASEGLLRLEGTARCFSLDAQSFQIGDNIKTPSLAAWHQICLDPRPMRQELVGIGVPTFAMQSANWEGSGYGTVFVDQRCAPMRNILNCHLGKTINVGIVC